MKLHPVLLPIPVKEGLTGRERIARQRHYARLALAECCKLSAVEPWDWQKGPTSAPLPHAGHYWAISHKPAFAAAVISDGLVGIDIERIEPRKRELHDSLAGRDEWVIMGDRSWGSFFRLWTAKEAILKAGGIGIADLLRCHLKSIEAPTGMAFRYKDEAWQVTHYFHQEHVVAVTSSSNEIEWHVLSQED